jgi:hypothetical protein
VYVRARGWGCGSLTKGGQFCTSEGAYSCLTARNISPQHNKPPDLIPNSHRRQKTPLIRVVTPHTPHAMVRRSATQQYNLSQDLMAEAINQANHCFSISPQTQKQKPKISIASDKVVIMPMANAVICPDTGKSLKHNELITKLKYRFKWMRSTANEINRLYNTNTIRFIQCSNIPKGRKVTYGSFVVDIKDHKEEKERTILTVGGDQIEYPGDKSTRTAGLTTAKILINSVISNLGAKFLVIDIKKFYLNTPLGRFEYMFINLSSLPQETIDKYDLLNLAQDGKVYIEIQKGMYGFVGRERAEHLMACIKKNYNISSDWNGTAYCGLTLEWDYKNRTVDLSMPGYIKADIRKYQHPAPARPEDAPHTWNPPIYGAKTQFLTEATTSPALPDKEINKLQQLTGTLLYYSRAVDPTLIMPINVLAYKQSTATHVTAGKVIKLLNYCNTHPESKIRYHTSDMILRIHSDASYLSEY